MQLKYPLSFNNNIVSTTQTHPFVMDLVTPLANPKGKCNFPDCKTVHSSFDMRSNKHKKLARKEVPRLFYHMRIFFIKNEEPRPVLKVS